MLLETTKTNGFTNEGIADLQNLLKKAVLNKIGDAVIENFYYGNNIDFCDVRLPFSHHYAEFTIYKNRIALTGYTCTNEEFALFAGMTLNDECYKSRLHEFANVK